MNSGLLILILMPMILIACQAVNFEDKTSPKISSLTPSSISAVGGDQIIISGSQLENIKKVMIGNRECLSLRKKSSELKCTSPSNSGQPEVLDVTLVGRDDNQIILEDAVSYTLIIGQPDAKSFGFRDRTLSSPYNSKVIAGKLMIMDYGNNRLLVWNTIPTSPNTSPDLIIGQPNGKEVLYEVDSISFKSHSFWTDGTKLAIPDITGNRVLLWNTFPTRNGQPADIVLGQPDFTTGTSNTGPNTPECGGAAGINACSMNSPRDVGFFDNKLYVTDTTNHRILIWNGWPDENQKPADIVLGQQSFLTATSNNGPNTPACGGVGGTNACSLSSPYYLFHHEGKLLVSDYSNHRVLIFNSLPIVSGTPADIVLGQPSVTARIQNNGPATAPCGGIAVVNRCSLRSPLGIFTDGTSIYVADGGNQRVLGWSAFPVAHQEPASLVLGQADFFSSSTNKGNTYPDSTSMSVPSSVFVHDNQLWVSDRGNNRTLRFGPVPLTDGASANLVMGHESFVNNIGNSFATSGDRLQLVPDAQFDGTHLIIADRINSRVIITNGLPQSFGSSSKIILGQANETSLNPNDGPNTVACGGVAGLNACSLDQPMAVLKVNNKLVVTDYNNRRVLIWNTIPTSIQQPADIVLGQPDFTSKANNNGPNTVACGGVAGRNKCSLSSPIGLASDGTNLIVSDIADNRVLIWNTFPTVNQQPADIVLGQPGFTTGTLNNGPNTPACDSTLGLNRCSLSQPFYMDIYAGKLIVTDRENHRVLIWNTMPTVDQQPADVVIGQPDFISNPVTNPPTASSLYTAGGVCVSSSGKLIISDMNNHRLVLYNSIPTSNLAVPDTILGQANSTANIGDGGLATGPGRFNTQYGVRCYQDKVFVSDYNNSRIQVFQLR